MDDEVTRRVGETIAKREEAARIADERAQALADAVPGLLDDILAAVAARTSHRVAANATELFCYIGPITAYQTVRLFAVELEEYIDEYSDPDAIAFNCTAFLSLNDDGQTEATGDGDMDRAAALDFGVEAVLDGLAALVADGHEILDANLILVAPTDTRSDTAGTGEQPGQEPHQVHSSPSVLQRVVSSYWFWFFVGAGGLVALGQIIRLAR